MLEFIVLGQIPGLHYTITFTTVLFILVNLCGIYCYQTVKNRYKDLRRISSRRIIYYFNPENQA